MQCRECGSTLADNTLFCPSCGTRTVMAAAAPAGSGRIAVPVASPSAEPSPMSPIPRPKGAAGAAAPTVEKKGAKPNLPQAGETFAGRYRVEKYLGLGALCNAYLCRDLAAGNREVVLKVMHARKAAEAGLPESFLFLAESVAKYDHKGIAKIFDTGRHEGAPYYTMEWVSGTPLRLWLMERLTFENRVLPGLGIISSLLDIFEAIHERGCYGCVKPENVFITLNGPVVTDFGVVGFLTSQEFEFNSYARRYLPYMAPELRQDWSNLLPHSDFYSIGAILYEILAGRAPGAQLRLPSELSSLFGIEADEIILKSMAARPMDRFATVEAFKQAVTALQATLLNARPESAPQPHEERTPSMLEATSSRQAIHNPDEAFADPATGSMPAFAPNATPPVPSTPAPAQENPWMHAPPADRRALGGSDDPAERTVFYPQDGRDGHEEDGKTLSTFASAGDRILEDAHSQRRFAHAQQIPAASGEPASAADRETANKWDGLADGLSPKSFDEEEESTPVPAWLWVCIALLGSGLVVASAYLGLARIHIH